MAPTRARVARSTSTTSAPTTRSCWAWALYNADGSPKTAPALAYGPISAKIKETGCIVPEVGGKVANTWSAKQHSKVPGFIFSDDLNLGPYVSKIG